MRAIDHTPPPHRREAFGVVTGAFDGEMKGGNSNTPTASDSNIFKQ